MSSDLEAKKARLIRILKEEGYILSSKVEKAMFKVPRELFIPAEYRELAYDDRPLPIGYGQTISAPSIVAYMTELLDPDVGMKVLEVGTGSGYQAAILAEIVAPRDVDRGAWGHVWSIERIKELAERAKKNLEIASYIERVTILVGDGSLGNPNSAPYDRIMVTAAAPDIPKPLLDQLKPGGRLVAPIGDMIAQHLVVVEKDREGRIHKRPTLEVIFVPLVGKYGWPEE